MFQVREMTGEQGPEVAAGSSQASSCSVVTFCLVRVLVVCGWPAGKVSEAGASPGTQGLSAGSTGHWK
jgi:hypothetical protein